jgi:hypothetical protein
MPEFVSIPIRLATFISYPKSLERQAASWRIALARFNRD